MEPDSLLQVAPQKTGDPLLLKWPTKIKGFSLFLVAVGVFLLTFLENPLEVFPQSFRMIWKILWGLWKTSDPPAVVKKIQLQ